MEFVLKSWNILEKYQHYVKINRNMYFGLLFSERWLCWWSVDIESEIDLFISFNFLPILFYHAYICCNNAFIDMEYNLGFPTSFFRFSQEWGRIITNMESITVRGNSFWLKWWMTLEWFWWIYQICVVQKS